MTNDQGLLLRVWSEACRHIEIHEFAGAIQEVLAAAIPLGLLRVDHLDVARGTLATLVNTGVDAGPANSGKMTLDSDGIKKLVTWLQHRDGMSPRGAALHVADSPAVDPSLILAGLGDREAIAIALLSEHGTMGIAVFAARNAHRFSADHVDIIQSLREPFTAALENHHRLHELAVLREAAEADTQALLAHLRGDPQLEPTIVGVQSGLKDVFHRVGLVARSDAPVLILGETGSGKEVVARAVHSGSARTRGPFLRVDCGAIPHELIDSQLFGHERGSFTGAVDSRRGWFERADGGTLFLDEIGELPLQAQVRLLRVLQDGQLERVGGQASIGVDVRIIAATHRDIASMVRDGRFREDLWFRINVFPIMLPPLRDRPEDIPALARLFAERAAARFGLTLQMPSPDNLALLLGYEWPGNIRELATVIDRAALLGNGQRLDISAALGSRTDQPSVNRPVLPPTSSHSGVALPQGPAAPFMPDHSRALRSPSSVTPIDDAMKEHIERALQRTLGRIEGPFGAARLLQINPHTLRARMRKLRIDWRAFRPPRS